MSPIAIKRQEQLLSRVSSMYLKYQFSDVTLVVEDKKSGEEVKLPTHKFILMANNQEYFASLLSPPSGQSTQDDHGAADGHHGHAVDGAVAEVRLTSWSLKGFQMMMKF